MFSVPLDRYLYSKTSSCILTEGLRTNKSLSYLCVPGPYPFICLY